MPNSNLSRMKAMEGEHLDARFIFFFPSTMWYQLPERGVGGVFAAAAAGK